MANFEKYLNEKGNASLSNVERTFIKETLNALLNGGTLGKHHYTVTITRKQLQNLVKKI